MTEEERKFQKFSSQDGDFIITSPDDPSVAAYVLRKKLGLSVLGMTDSELTAWLSDYQSQNR